MLFRTVASSLIFCCNRQGGGTISACGGDGLAGGGGGRVSVDVFSRHDDSQFFVHGNSLDFICIMDYFCSDRLPILYLHIDFLVAEVI